MDVCGVKRSCFPSPEEASCSFHTPPACIEDLPPEILKQILGHLSPRDLLSFGGTCSRLHQHSQSPLVWKEISSHIGLPVDSRDWQRLAILKYTQALHMQCYPARRCCRARRSSTFRAVDPPAALGYRRMVPISEDMLLLLDFKGTLFLLRSLVMRSDSGQILNQKMAAQPTLLCCNVQDFAVDPQRKVRHHYVYVLAGTGDSGPPGSNILCIYRQDTGAMVFTGSLGQEASFTQIHVSGSQVTWQLLFLNDAGHVYSMSMYEVWLDLQRAEAVHRIIGDPQDHVSVSQIHSSQSRALYLTGEGSAYLEIHYRRAYLDMFCHLQVVVPRHTPVHLPLLNKVVKCSLGESHLCLVDEQGGIFMQGRNSYGQLGTGDRVDRGQPTQVAVFMRPVDVWCGPSYTLALLQDESGAKEVHGCGLGDKGRLPGHPEGSNVFVRLNVKVPWAAHSICAMKGWLFVICSHDIAEPLLSAVRQ